MELSHLEGYKGSKPVRIGKAEGTCSWLPCITAYVCAVVGNAAFSQVQLDIYGELMDTVYLSNKHAEPLSFEVSLVAGVAFRRMMPTLLLLQFWAHIVKASR